MPSFDIVSKTDLAEVDNALANMTREMSQRYDSRTRNRASSGTAPSSRSTPTTGSKLKQMHELLQGHLARRKIDVGVLDYKTLEKAAGQAVRQKALIRQGIDKELAKRLVKEIKDGKFKVQVTIQGDELRVSGKKRDDLQAVIQHIKGLQVELPLQYLNFRDRPRDRRRVGDCDLMGCADWLSHSAVTAMLIAGCGVRTGALSLGMFSGGSPEAAEESTSAIPVAPLSSGRMSAAAATPVDAYVTLGGRIETCWFDADAPLLPNHVYRADVSPDGDKVQITIHQKIELGRAGLSTYAIDFTSRRDLHGGHDRE